MKKKSFIIYVLALLALAGCDSSSVKTGMPVIYSTDLYHPPQDPDDHYDLAMLNCLEELEVKALVFDVATPNRNPEEIGKNALEQMAIISGRKSPPWKTGLLYPLRTPDDQALDQPEEYQGGVRLILSTLEQSKEQVVMFLVGSCRDFVVAFNRNPDLLRNKVKAVYVNAGNGPTGIQTEWNVTLDPHAYVGLMFSGLPIYWCPCITDSYQLCSPEDVSAGKAFCTYFIVPDQAELLASTRTIVKNYFSYALYRSKEDPLSFLDKEQQQLPHRPRNMWCTGPFLHAAGRKIYQTQDHRWIASDPEKVKSSPAVEVFHFEPVRIKYIMKEVDGKQLPEFVEDENATTTIQVFRYIHPDFNEIMSSVLAGILETL